MTENMKSDYRNVLVNLAKSPREHGRECGSCTYTGIKARYARHQLALLQSDEPVTRDHVMWVLKHAEARWKRTKHWKLYHELLAAGASPEAIEAEFAKRGWCL